MAFMKIQVIINLFLITNFHGITLGMNISFNFDTGPILVHTNCSCGTYTFHETEGSSFLQTPTYILTTADIGEVTAEFDDLNAKNREEGQREDDDLVAIEMVHNTTDQRQLLLTDFAAVLPSKESNFKVLPFKMTDIYSILKLTRLPSLHADKDRPKIHIPVKQSAQMILDHWVRRTNVTSFSARNLKTGQQNLLMTIMFFTISYNSEIDSNERYEICITNDERTDVPLVLVRCCSIQDKPIFDVDFKNYDVRCTYPDYARELLTKLAQVMAILFTAFSPLLVKCIPSKPRSLHLKEGKPDHSTQGTESKGIFMKNLKHLKINNKIDEIISAGKEYTDKNNESTEEQRTQKEEFEGAKIDIDCRTDSGVENEGNENNHLSPRNLTSRTMCQDRIFLNCNPEYRLNPSMLAYYALFFNYNRLPLIILRRFLLLFTLWALVGYLAFVIFNYYNSMLDDLVLISWQAKIFNGIMRLIYKDEYDTYDPNNTLGVKTIYMVVVAVPAIMSLVQMLLLYSIFFTSKNICSTLNWERDDMIINIEPTKKYSETFAATGNESSQRVLYERLKFRFSLLFYKDYWLSLWKGLPSKSTDRRTTHRGNFYREINPGLPNNGRNQFKADKSRLDSPEQFISRENNDKETHKSKCPLLKLKATVMCPIKGLLAGLPIFSIWTSVFVRPKKTTARPNWRNRCCFNNDAYQVEEEERCPQFSIGLITMAVSCLGIALFTLMVSNFAVLYSQAILFLFIDVFRHSEALLPKCIFVASILLYIHQAFLRFEDGYRSIKLTVFEICQGISDNMQQGEEDNLVLSYLTQQQGISDSDDNCTCTDKPIPLLTESEDGQISIPRQLFVDVCAQQAPYKSRVFHCFLELGMSLLIIFFLFYVALEFQVFAEFSALGESMFTLATMSVPYIFGGVMRSEVYTSLSKARTDRQIESLIRGRIVKKPKSDFSLSNKL